MSDIRGVAHSGSGQSRSVRDGHHGVSVTPDGSLFSADYLHALAREGRIFFAGDSALGQTITGATSLATTTPMILLDVPDETVAIPLYVSLGQTGTVGGGEITVHVEIDNAGRYSSGGTSQTILSSRTDNPTSNNCTLYTLPTATDGYGIGIWGGEFVEDVAPEVADDFRWHNWVWTPPVPIYVVGAGAFIVNAEAGTTGPSYYWSVAWAEIPESELN